MTNSPFYIVPSFYFALVGMGIGTALHWLKGSNSRDHWICCILSSRLRRKYHADIKGAESVHPRFDRASPATGNVLNGLQAFVNNIVYWESTIVLVSHFFRLLNPRLPQMTWEPGYSRAYNYPRICPVGRAFPRIRNMVSLNRAFISRHRCDGVANRRYKIPAINRHISYLAIT